MAGIVPEGYHTITPYFTVADADRLISFVTAAFDGRVVSEDRDENGRIRHARIRIGDSVIMLNEAAADYPPNDSQLHLYVIDVDVTLQRALGEGASAVMQPNERPHGGRMAGVRDPCGNTWWIAAPVDR
ncbi:MAG: VOC family protein [Ilumatobacteraceae bacterium]